jgi:hypothetical protein
MNEAETRAEHIDPALKQGVRAKALRSPYRLSGRSISPTASQ